MKKEFHYSTAGDGVEYSFRFEFQSFIGRRLFYNRPKKKMDIVIWVVEIDSFMIM